MADAGKRRTMGEVSPSMSATSMLVSVEDLIHMAMGPENVNVINFKLLQTVLHILARQMRLLEQRVEVKISDYITLKTDEAKEEDAVRSAAADEKRRAEKEAARAEREAARAGKDAAKAEKESAKAGAKAEKEAAKAEKESAKAGAKAEKEAAKSEKESAKAGAKAEKEAAKSEKESAKAGAKAEKEAAKAEKEAAKAEKGAQRTAEKEKKDIEKALAAETKEKEKQEKAAAKGEKAAEKEAAKGEKAAEKEKAAAERAASKEREKAAKAAGKGGKAGSKRGESDEDDEPDEELRAGRGKDGKGGKAGKAGRAKDEKGVGAKGSETSIMITEAERDKQKVLVVEKGPTTRSASVGGAAGSRNIEVVTRSQFDLLKDLVNDLAEKAGPLPMPSLPKNKELLQRLSKGTASLTDMMGAMQVNARVKAAEQAIGRMGGILTQLATAGALPEDIAGQIGEVTSELKAELREAGGGVGSTVAIGIGRASQDAGLDGPRESKSAASAASRKSILATKSKYGTRASSARPSSLSATGSTIFLPKVTHTELDDAVRALKEDMTKNMHQITAKAATSAEAAMTMAKGVAEKLDVATKLNGRITTLYSQVNDYADQLSGFDAGLSTQMQGFSEQMVQMRADLKQGLNLLESVNNNSENAAVLELTERYEGLVTELDHTLHFHQELTIHQGQLGEDLRGLIEAVEMLREQKADRDEVQDGLRDKADNSRLAGLLTEEEFARSRMELERRLAVCHNKFSRQDEVWMQAIKELKGLTDVKADLIQLLGLRDEAQEALQMLHQMCQNLALVLGDPKAAIITRKLTRGATCGPCFAPALMDAEDEYAGAPFPLPAARPHPTGAPSLYEEPCEVFKLPQPPDTREHICHRWVGGSHTLVVPGVVTRAHTQPMTYDAVPTNRFTGYGQDGRLYMMEEELQPCIECNKLSDEAEETGGGDRLAKTLPPIEG